jgi:AMP deaminase
MTVRAPLLAIFSKNNSKLLEGVLENAAAEPDAEPQPLFDVPTLRDYYVDLDKVLNVVSDGTTKSFCFRQLKYLQSKWTMYTLLNEHEEMAAMKVFSWLCCVNRN